MSANSDELDQWSAKLQELARQPLGLCPDFPRLAERYEAWWRQSLDRPLLIGLANNNPARPVTRRLDLVEQPERWLESKLADLKQLVRTPDTLPHIRADFGATILGGILGARTEFSSDTNWTHAFIDDAWSNVPHPWQIDPENRWWRAVQRLLDVAAAAAKDRFLICTPSLGGPCDVLTNLRGATELCMDVLERTELIAQTLAEMHRPWQRAFQELYRRVVAIGGAGLIHWHLLWSNVPYVVSECDLCYSLGPQEFVRVCLPDIARQAATTGRSVYHLDGPGSTRHIDPLLEIPHIKAIQYTPGAGSPSALAWIDMFRKIQSKGRSLLIFAPAGEVVDLTRLLRPDGLAISIEGAVTVQQLELVSRQVASG
jgi:hypothetical protein